MNPSKRMLIFNKAFNITEIRAKNQESSILLRKNKRFEHLGNKRSLILPGGGYRSEQKYDISQIPFNLHSTYPELFHSSSTFSLYLTTFVSCENSSLLIYFVEGLRKIISSENRPSRDLIFPEVPKKLASLMGFNDFTKECIWCLINLASETDVKMLIEIGVVEAVIETMTTNDEEILDLCIWCLANISGDSIEARNVVLETGIIDKLLELLESPLCMQNCAWCISNLCKGKPYPPMKILAKVFEKVKKLMDIKDEVLAGFILDIVFCITNTEAIKNFDWSFVEKVYKHLDTKKQSKIDFIALKIIGNIIVYTDEIIEILVEKGMLDKLLYYLNCYDIGKCKESLLILSNICTGPKKCLLQVIEHEVFTKAVSFLISENKDLKIEAMWIVKNICELKEAQYKFLQTNVICDLIKIMNDDYNEIIDMTLDIFRYLLRNDSLKDLFDQIGGTEALTKLQKNGNLAIYMKSSMMISEFYEFDNCNDL
ncbi:hypothetical protein SteCoe_10775 [Stentor coeruleus]|uniref:Importin subunit alpha n=1 Tax=Stentor coeruleus TaxID=5963 RepID=A0A1R2CES9_9CILI|nr:hypothetical protein SteCoe_10775 [Stentor coeruleus]